MTEDASRLTRRNRKSLWWRLALCLMTTRKVFQKMRFSTQLWKVWVALSMCDYNRGGGIGKSTRWVARAELSWGQRTTWVGSSKPLPQETHWEQAWNINHHLCNTYGPGQQMHYSVNLLHNSQGQHYCATSPPRAASEGLKSHCMWRNRFSIGGAIPPKP